LNLPQTAQSKTSSYDKYLYAGQVGLDWKITKDLNFKGSLGYYYFQNAQGQVSSPMVTPNAQTQGNTDDSRPLFAQRGNSYMQLRNIQKVSAYPTNSLYTASGGTQTTFKTNTTTANYFYNPDYTDPNYVATHPTDTGLPPLPYYTDQFQYFGLITPFNILSANGRLEYRHWEPFVVSLPANGTRTSLSTAEAS